MARHDGVSCDSCLSENFKGKRYKCLICYDYDLCEICYENDAMTGPHITTHGMQCILTRTDCELYYGGEQTLQLSQSFTCPYCSQNGFTELDLIDHVTVNHAQMSIEVTCPICAANPLRRTNVVREDFIGHLNFEHRNPQREIISFFDDAPRHGGVRRIQVHNSRLSTTRGRRSNISFSLQNNRENNDPITEFLTQLRRSEATLPTPLERQIRGRASEKNPKKTVGVTSQNITSPTAEQSGISVTSQQTAVKHNSHLLIPICLFPLESVSVKPNVEVERADKGLFVSNLVLSTLKEICHPI